MLTWYTFAEERLGCGLWHLSTAFIIVAYDVFSVSTMYLLTRQLSRFLVTTSG